MNYLKDEDFLISLGKHIRNVRLKHGYTQEQLAFKIQIEISQISRLERGVLNTSVSLIKAISDALGVPVKDLFDF